MSDNEFLKSIIDVASELKGSPITENEKVRIIEAFNSKKNGSAYDRAKIAIEEVLQERVTIHQESIILEKAAPLNNLQYLLSQMNSAANNWQQNKEKK